MPNLLREYIRSLLIEVAIGQCYPHAVKMAQGSSQEEFSDLTRFKVVHGRVTDKYSGESFLHAWVEKADVVFDWQTHATKPTGIPKDVYYDTYTPEIHDEYTAEETMVNCLKSGQAGPWSMQESVLLEQDQGSKGSLVVVDIQPEYESGTPFDIGDMLRTAADSYSRVLFLYNGPDLGMIDESGLKNFYFEKLDYDEEAFNELLSKSKFFDKGYGFFRDVMDSDLCFDRSSVIKIVKYMIDNDYRDIRDLEEEDVEAIGVSELLFDDLEDYGFYIPDLEEVLPNWSGSDIAGGARNECLAEVEILGAAQGLSFNQVGRFIYEGDNRYTDRLNEGSERAVVSINGTPMEVELASDNRTRLKGLMHRESLPYDAGMLFVFPDAAERSFHMRDTHVPLSIAFADSNGKIKTVKDMYPYDEEGVTSDCDAAYALEVNQGYFDDNGITIGDIINIER